MVLGGGLNCARPGVACKVQSSTRKDVGCKVLHRIIGENRCEGDDPHLEAGLRLFKRGSTIAWGGPPASVFLSVTVCPSSCQSWIWGFHLDFAREQRGHGAVDMQWWSLMSLFGIYFSVVHRPILPTLGVLNIFFVTCLMSDVVCVMFSV